MSEAEIWDQLAGRYDTIVRFFNTSYGKVRARLAQDVPSGKSVLEVAAGTGQFTAELAYLADRLLTSDVSPAMLQRLRERVTGAGIANVDYAVLSAYHLDAPDASFDAVFCANALHVMEEPARALAEFRRVLRDDGLLIAPTFLHGEDGVRRVISRSLSLVSPFVAHTRFDLASLQVAIANAGFNVEHAEKMPGLFPLGYVVARPAT